ncbi:MAG: citrate lyase subunit alpha [Erysipelothrix sp.]|nr:citrate lyase subunit alpha [Erysipelothrix sp.]
MKNSLNREVPFHPFQGVKTLEPRSFEVTKHVSSENKYRDSLSDLVKELNIKDGDALSFHHHLRNGDHVLNMVMAEVAKLGVKNLKVVASSLFPIHKPLVELFEKGIVTEVYAAYISGPVAKAISEGKLKGMCMLHSHGYRATMIETGEVTVDFAFIASPACSMSGNVSGSEGPSNCGVLGYAIADAQFAKKVIAVTDYIVEPKDVEIKAEWVDYVVKVEKIGDPKGIVSGTTQITRDPVGLKIAKMTLELMKGTGLLKDGFSFQTGAGGISLAVAKDVFEYCKKEKIKGSFASGGTTSYLVNMLEAGIFEYIYDVQCFELDAVASISRNENHKKMSAAQYADIYNPDNIVNRLDFVILGATEMDTDFNVNVTTGTDGIIMGGSGGHSDTAAGAKMAIIVSKLVSSRISVLTDQVTTVTTPGETVDALVTDRGIAIHPRHQALIDHLKATTKLPIFDIHELYQMALDLTGVPEKVEHEERIVALSQYRDGTLLDCVYQVKSE